MTSPSVENSIKTVGLCAFNDIPDQHKFLSACGFNLFQFIESGYSKRPDALDPYYTGQGPRSNQPGAMDSGYT